MVSFSCLLYFSCWYIDHSGALCAPAVSPNGKFVAVASLQAFMDESSYDDFIAVFSMDGLKRSKRDQADAIVGYALFPKVCQPLYQRLTLIILSHIRIIFH